MRVEKDGFCALCWSQCGARYTIEDDRIVAVAPLSDHPNGGALCPKGRAAPEILESPDRLLHPLKRTTPKSDPDPKWKRITWDEALDEVAERLGRIRAESGAEAVAFSTATNGATGLSDSIEWIDRLIRVFGSPNKINAVELCDFPKTFVHPLTFGTSIPYPDVENSDAIVLWGFNPSSTWLSASGQIAAARARGAKVMVVDPRHAGFGLEADRWLRIRPGADGVLALGIANLLIQRNAFDEDFVRRWSSASLLVRTDTGAFVRGRDAGRDHDPDAYLAWDEARGAVVYDAGSRSFEGETANLRIRGPVDLATRHGVLRCRPAFDLYAEACAAYPLDRVARLTWLEPRDIEAFADGIARARRLSYYVWTGVSQHAQAGQIDRAIALLMALKGSYDAPGGNVVCERLPRASIGDLGLLPAGQYEKTLGLDALPLGPPAHGMVTARHFQDAVLDRTPYGVRGLVGFGANMVLAHADGLRTREALQKLDIYVHCDLFENPTARYADILLPVSTIWEQEGLRIGFEAQPSAEEHVQLRQRMVPPRGQARSDVAICFALAQRLGHGASFFDGSIERGYEAMLRPVGLSLEELRARPNGIRRPLAQRHRKYAEATPAGRRGFATETGLVEIYSERLLRHGQAAVPDFIDTLLPGHDEAYPLALTSAKSGYFCHSQHRGIASLRKREPHPTVEVTPETAGDMGLDDGDWAYVETGRARVRMKVKTNPSLHPRVARGSYGWWQGSAALGLPAYDAFGEAGANYNLLVDATRFDPISGAPAHRSTGCRLRRVGVAAEWSGFRRFRVAAIERETEDILEIALRPVEAFPLPDYEPGQHVTIRDRDRDTGVALIRSYSLVGPAHHGERTAYRIAVRRCPAPDGRADLPHGAMSSHVHERLTVDDTVDVKPPAGRFRLPLRSTRPVVLVAGGVGITPFLSYLETLARGDHAPRVHLVTVNRRAALHGFRDRIEALRPRIPSLTLCDLYTREAGGGRGILTADRMVCGDFTGEPLVFLCGPNGLMRSARALLVGRGLSPETIHQETFAPEAIDETALPEGPFTVTFARSCQTVTWTRESGSLLALGEKRGLVLPSGCRVGQCESCAVAIRSGTAVHRVAVNQADDGQCLLCQAVPTSDLVVEA